MTERTVSLLILVLSLVPANFARAGDPNLVGYWKMDEIFGRIAYDSSGKGNDGNLVGEVYWAPVGGKFGGAAGFDKSDDESRVEIPVEGMAASAGTVALWTCLSGTQSGTRYFWGYSTGTSSRIQLYMDNDDTWLGLGLGDKNQRKNDIIKLSVGIWYHIVLTWEKGNYAVYVNDVRKAQGTYTGLDSLPSSVAHIGNEAKDRFQGRNHSVSVFCGLIDEVTIFNRALDEYEVSQLYRLGTEAFLSEPMLQPVANTVRQAKVIANEQGHQKAVAFLGDEIAKYEQWKEANSNRVGLTCKLLFSDLYFLWAKYKEAAGFPKKGLIDAYKNAILSSQRTGERSSALTWLFENISNSDYKNIVKTNIRNPRSAQFIYPGIVKQLEMDNNWPAFESFLDVIFNETEDAVASAKLIEQSLSEDGYWKKEYVKYCRDKSQLTDYVFEKDCGAAEENAAEGCFQKALEIYRGITKLYPSDRHKLLLELKICECLFDNGECQNAISELDQFIAGNKAVNVESAVKAMLMKGRLYLRQGRVEKALDEFQKLAAEYPESLKMPDVSLFIGYCYMLQGKFKEAAEAFNIVVRAYPETSCAGKARICLAYIQDKFEIPKILK